MNYICTGLRKQKVNVVFLHVSFHKVVIIGVSYLFDFSYQRLDSLTMIDVNPFSFSPKKLSFGTIYDIYEVIFPRVIAFVKGNPFDTNLFIWLEHKSRENFDRATRIFRYMEIS